MPPPYTCQNGYVFTKTENTSNDEDVEQQELSLAVGGSAKWHGLLGRRFGSSYKAELSVSSQPSNFAHSYVPKWFENVCPYKNLHANAYSCFIQNCQTLGATKMPFIRQMDRLRGSHTTEYYSVKKKKRGIKSWKDTKEPQIPIAKWQKPVCKGHMLWEYNYKTS